VKTCPRVWGTLLRAAMISPKFWSIGGWPRGGRGGRGGWPPGPPIAGWPPLQYCISVFTLQLPTITICKMLKIQLVSWRRLGRCTNTLINSLSNKKINAVCMTTNVTWRRVFLSKVSKYNARIGCKVSSSYRTCLPPKYFPFNDQ